MCDLVPELLPGDKRVFKHRMWTFEVAKDHILRSSCKHPDICQSVSTELSNLCEFCNCTRQLPIPKLPDMLFPNNYLKLCHDNGNGINFVTLDALKQVSTGSGELIEVAAADSWKQARTGYKGTLHCQDKPVSVTKCDESINYERLKMNDVILFYEDVHLFEDELSDHGISLLTVKVRVMPRCFLVLQRFYLRVDDVLVRIYDTRLYHEDDRDYLIREYTARESRIEDLKRANVCDFTGAAERLVTTCFNMPIIEC